jgi:hypothetical protein
MGGLHDDRNGQPRFAHARKHAETIEIGHDQVEHNTVDAFAVGARQQIHGDVAAVSGDHLVTEAAHHVVE